MSQGNHVREKYSLLKPQCWYVCMSHLVFVFDLYVQRQSEANLRQLWDQDAIFRAVKPGWIVIFIDQQDGEGGHDSGRRGCAIVIQLCGL